ncbi:MAG: SDR family NAD(P)-dependent oxidoreductase [SAR202 cluster bacterium]|nr:SDR family NAD(P)-dependent oxidoreductase [SAR202 cluster bacterium]
MELTLNGKNAIVTGGGSNIGRSIALTLAEEGANIAIFDLDETAALGVFQEAKEAGATGEMAAYATDLTDRLQVEASVGRVAEKFEQIDILINCVGGDEAGPFLGQSPELHEKLVDLNYMSVVYCMRTILPHMVERGYGRVVSLASDAGRMGEFHEAVYSGAKAGVIALTKSLAREVGRHNVTLNVICPGLTIPEDPEAVPETSMLWAGDAFDFWTPERRASAARRYALRRLGNAQDVANVAVFLASDRCNFVTGQTWSVSGGYTMM